MLDQPLRSRRRRKAKPIRQPEVYPPFRICSPAWVTWTQDKARTGREEKNGFYVEVSLDSIVDEYRKGLQLPGMRAPLRAQGAEVAGHRSCGSLAFASFSQISADLGIPFRVLFICGYCHVLGVYPHVSLTLRDGEVSDWDARLLRRAQDLTSALRHGAVPRRGGAGRGRRCWRRDPRGRRGGVGGKFPHLAKT